MELKYLFIVLASSNVIYLSPFGLADPKQIPGWGKHWCSAYGAPTAGGHDGDATQPFRAGLTFGGPALRA